MVAEIIAAQYTRAQDLLKMHVEKLHQVAAYLFKHEKMDGTQFEKMMKGELALEI